MFFRTTDLRRKSSALLPKEKEFFGVEGKTYGSIVCANSKLIRKWMGKHAALLWGHPHNGRKWYIILKCKRSLGKEKTCKWQNKPLSYTLLGNCKYTRKIWEGTVENKSRERFIYKLTEWTLQTSQRSKSRGWTSYGFKECKHNFCTDNWLASMICRHRGNSWEAKQNIKLRIWTIKHRYQQKHTEFHRISPRNTL